MQRRPGRRATLAALTSAAVGLCSVALACGADPPRTAEPAAPSSVLAPPASVVTKPLEKPARTLLAVARPSFPAPGASGVCTDATLSLSVEGAAVVGSSGSIRVIDVEAPGELVDVVDLGAAGHSDVIGGRSFRLPSPVTLEGRVAHVRLKNGALEPHRTYAVTIDDGVFLDAAGRSLGALADTSVWRFTTRAPSPASPGELVVSADGKGDFCSVQGAFDFVPSDSTRPLVIHVKRGTYREIVFVENKRNVTLRGEDRQGTLIAFSNNENLQNKQGSKLRALAGFENVSDFVIENLTFHNTTPQGGSQAEALRIDPGERVIVRNATFLSRQDTLLLTGTVYVTDSYIEGNVDYVWGKGTAVFERVELRTVGRPGWNVQARNPPERYGYVFVDSTLSAAPDVSGHLLGRIDATRFPGSHVAYIDCRMAPAIDPKGWEITPPGTPATKGIRFWEHGTRGLDEKPLPLGKRHPASQKLTRAEALRMRDKRHVFGGWDPAAPGPH